ncbi:MAG TPA: helix-turn-helix domain-containing protein, partial [Solirubrobacterales bacterium]|nr:helix-turn-helix domain-containing protein [Solirubrobacterales bacterium]
MDRSVGDKLREARTRRRLSLAEAEEATKIRTRYLQAIENEEWDQLPGDTYARAFIRTYGRFLGLDGDRLAEEQRLDRGASRPGERLPRVDPRPRPVSRRRPGRRRSLPPRLVAGVVIALVVVALLAIGLWTGGRDEAGQGDATGAGGKAAVPGAADQKKRPPASKPGHSLSLVARGEVWVCLLNGRRSPLVDGRILAPGDAEGPFRSGSFTLALGNGAVTMTVDGKQANLPEPASPIGFAVGSDGSVRELP